METIRLKGISHIFSAIPSHIWLIQSMKNISPEPTLALGNANSCEFFHFVPLILCLSQCLFQLFQLIRWGIAVRGRACNADGGSGAKEKTHLHHEKQALANDEEALCAQVLGPILSCCQLHFASPKHGIFADFTITLQTWKSDRWTCSPYLGLKDQS